MGTEVTQKDVTFKIKIHAKENAIVAPVDPVVEPVVEPIVEPVVEPVMPVMPEPEMPSIPMEPIVVMEPMPVMPEMEMPMVMEPIVMEPVMVPEIMPDEFVAEIKQTDDGTSVAVDFEEAAGASLDGQNPEDLSLNVEVMDPAGEVEMAQVSMA